MEKQIQQQLEEGRLISVYEGDYEMLTAGYLKNTIYIKNL